MKLKGKILIITSLIILIAIIFNSGFNIFVANNSVSSVVEMQLIDQIKNLENEIKTSEEIVQITKDALNEKNIAIARGVAELIKSDSSWLGTRKLKVLARSFGVDEIHVTDGRGVIQFGTVEDFFGFDFSTTDQTKPFMDLIGAKDGAFAQEPSPRGTDGSLFQYIGVTRTDVPGIVQVGVEPTTLQALLQELDVQKSVEALVIGEGGYAMIIDENGMIRNHKDPSKIGMDKSEFSWLDKVEADKNELVIYDEDGTSYFGYAKDFEGLTLVLSYPRAALNEIIVGTIISNAIIVVVSILILIFVIQFVINKWVSKPLKQVQEGMSALGQGDFSTVINYKSKDEIGALVVDFEAMTGNVKHLIKETSNSIESVLVSSNSINENVEALNVTTQ